MYKWKVLCRLKNACRNIIGAVYLVPCEHAVLPSERVVLQSECVVLQSEHPVLPSQHVVNTSGNG